jgi:hypothetical protein
LGGFIVLEDGRAWAAASWAYDAAVRYLARSLDRIDTGEAQALSVWLLTQTNERLGAGMGRIDFRELTPENRALLRRAARHVFADLEQHPPADWGDPAFFGPWLERFHDLLLLMKSVDRRESPETFNPHMRGLIEPTGRKTGPGWE